MGAKKRMSQNDLILSWLHNNGSITPREAMMYLNIYRLAARIAELRLNHNIKTYSVRSPGGAYHARYEYVGPLRRKSNDD